MHKTLWFKIHWILGFIFGLTLIIIGVTGSTLSFEKEIKRFFNKDSYIVEVPQDQAKLSAKELLEKYQESNPKAKINSISFSSNLESSVVLNIASEEPNERKGKNVYLNPYTAEVLPEIKGNDFFSLMLRLHRWLAFEGDYRTVGKQVVAISTIACIILTISGLIIYWPRVKHAFFKSFTFSFKHKNRAFLSTMHSAVGMWVIPLFLLMTLTGLYWSYDWYRAMLYNIAGVEQPVRAQQPQAKEGQEAEGQKGQAEQGQKDKRAQDGQNARMQGEKPEGDMPRKEGMKPDGQKPQQQKAKSNFNEHQKAINMFEIFVQKDYENATLRFPQKGTIYSISYLDVDAAHYRARNTIEVDINSWQLLKHDKYEDKPLNEKLIGSMLPLHTGEYFGVIGQTLAFIASGLMALFVITGYMLYYDRWKKKKAKALKEKAKS